MSSTPRLRLRTKLSFGVGAAAEAAVTIAFNTWNLLFYNHVLGLSGKLCGLAVALSLVLDAFADPLIGFVSDSWKSRLGRRHPFLYAAPIPLAASFFCIYVPPAGLEGVPLFLWFTFFTVLFRQSLSLYQVPHLALGAELSEDYRERSVVMSYNAIFAVIGGASTFFYGWTWFHRIPGGTNLRSGYPGLAAGVAIFSALAILSSAFFTRDQIPRLPRARSDARFTLAQMRSEVSDCLKNRNYVMLLLGLVAFSGTLGTRETIMSYTNLFYWQLPEDKIRIFGLVTPPAFVLAFVLTVRLHGWFDKRETIMGALAVTVFAAAFPVSARLLGHFPDNGSPKLFPLLLMFTALGYGGVAVLQISVLSALADIADEHELAVGRRQEGIFYAARTFFGKLTQGLGTILAGLAIDIIQFPKGAKPGEVSAEVLTKLGVIDGPIAALPAVLAIFFYASYRIDKHRHAEIQRQLIARRSQPPQAGADAAAGAAPLPARS